VHASKAKRFAFKKLVAGSFVGANVRASKVSAKLVTVIQVAGEVAERFKAHAWKACVG
jgi:hypothetical protein